MKSPVQPFSKLSHVDRIGQVDLFDSKENPHRSSFRLFELVVRQLDLESLLEFFEQIRLLTETPVTKRVSDLSPMSHQNLFPLHVVIERIGDMTLGQNNG